MSVTYIKKKKRHGAECLSRGLVEEVDGGVTLTESWALDGRVKASEAYAAYAQRCEGCVGETGSLEGARAYSVAAHELALAAAGSAPDAALLWRAYRRFVESWPASGERLSALRRVLQRSVALPVDGVEELWAEYERFDRRESEALAKELLARHQPLHASKTGRRPVHVSRFEF